MHQTSSAVIDVADVSVDVLIHDSQRLGVIEVYDHDTLVGAILGSRELGHWNGLITHLRALLRDAQGLAVHLGEQDRAHYSALLRHMAELHDAGNGARAYQDMVGPGHDPSVTGYEVEAFRAGELPDDLVVALEASLDEYGVGTR